ncbi:pentatricopeptide repeat-containing protein At1g74600, chloroplastic [Diospyros lotus]|uniref:pentatricopeptide repeat-containing protein At1g74600, chloroplastic n=1 Tax=Diospyros lotus TaxID=55363 RepID=UPI00225C0DBF|nr:pentatricopeptide repeat-containing protein At1g74600, chloroplastic [Diospyros lotus]
MNYVLNPNLQTKFLVLGRKFASSLALVRDPSNFREGREPTLSPLDPPRFFNDWINSRKSNVAEVKAAHAHFLKSITFHSDIFLAKSFVDFYCKFGQMVYAVRVFEQIPDPSTDTRNILISGYNQNLLFRDSWRTFCEMYSFGFEPNQFTYGSILSACGGLQSPLCGKLVYSVAMKNGFFSNGYVRAGMVDLFAKCGSLDEALSVFYDVSCHNVVCWNAIISGAVKNKENWVALGLFSQMSRAFLMPNSFTFSSILTACAALEEFQLGKGVQAWVIKCGAEDDVFVGTAVVDFYAKSGDMDGALKEFLRMPVCNVVSWTAMISGFVRKGDSISALQFFKQMVKMKEEINSYTVTSILTACADPAMVKEAIQIHGWIFKTEFYFDSTVKASLMNMYSKIGEIDLCEMAFREREDLGHLGIWALVISALAQNNRCGRAIEMFQRMYDEGLRPDKFCTSSILSIIDSLNLGRQIHCYTLKSGLVFDVSVASSLFTMYSKGGSLVESYEVFQQIVEKDNVSWASMIAGFAEHGHADQGIKLFRKMLFEETKPDEMSLTAVLTACSALHSLNTGKQVHGYAVRGGVGKKTFCGALVNMYSKCGALDTARKVFDMMPVKDQVSCSSLVSGHAQNDRMEEALALFREMQMGDLEVDSFTLSSVIGSVSVVNRVGIGTQLHALVAKIGLQSEASVGSSLVMMYSKGGSIDNCQRAFEQIKKPDVVSWTSMISSYAQHGRGAEALRIYELMRQSGTKPDSVTFVGVLSACSRSGLVEEGYLHLNSMVRDHGIQPGYRHYACMVDLLGRSGRLKEAESFIYSMPIKPDALIWGTLLAACKMHGDFELGRLAARKIFELEPCDAGAFVSFSNILADVGQWEEVLKVRDRMKGTGMMKDPGWSSV